MNHRFHGLLANEIDSYLQYKRALGRKFNTEERALHLLDRYLMENGVTEVTAIQPTLIEAFLASRPQRRPRSYNHLLGVVRCFFKWLVCQERLDSSPVRAHPRRVTYQYRPFLFESAQFKQLLAETAQLPNHPRAPHRSEIYSLIFSLMYGLGLRVGEVVGLRYRDVDLERALLVIDKSKFGKTRLVPFGPGMARRIIGYLERCVSWYGRWQPHDPVFAFSFSPERRPIRTETISMTFHHLLPKLGLQIPPGVDQPRLHGLRHSFAVAALLRWYRTGVDPNQRLVHLSTFMGHASPASTAWYLTITDDLLKAANQRFERFVTDIEKEGRP